MDQDNSLAKEIKSLNLFFKFTYVLVALIASAGVAIFYHSTQKRLARSYSFATRNSIVIRDYRQALTSLAPVIDDGFSGVAVLDRQNQLVLQIPTEETGKSNAKSMLTTAIVQNLSVDKTSNSNVASIIFYYSIFIPLIICLVVSIGLFFIFSQIFRRSRSRLEERHNLIIHQKKLEAASQLAAQVAHDIRSPLSALNMMASTLVDSNDEKRILIKNAVQRINDISNDLLQKGKKAPKEKYESHNSIPISSIIDEIVNEKKMQYSHRVGLSIISDVQQKQKIHTSIPSKELSRILSNLINNSAEAFEENDGNIIVSLRSYPDKVSIIIQDDGKGIPEEILSRLGERGLSHGKTTTESGSGLGVWHAKSAIESAGGDFRVLSRGGVGTQVIINLPIRITDQE